MRGQLLFAALKLRVTPGRRNPLCFWGLNSQTIPYFWASQFGFKDGKNKFSLVGTQRLIQRNYIRSFQYQTFNLNQTLSLTWTLSEAVFLTSQTVLLVSRRSCTVTPLKVFGFFVPLKLICEAHSLGHRHGRNTCLMFYRNLSVW